MYKNVLITFVLDIFHDVVDSHFILDIFYCVTDSRIFWNLVLYMHILINGDLY